jgi:hypothetical protein
MPDLDDTIESFSEKPVEPDWLAIFKKRRREGISSTAKLKERAIENHRFAAPGEEQLPYDPTEGGRGRSTTPARRRKFAMMSVNEVHPVVSAMSGRQTMDRFERRYVPRKKEARPWAEVLSTWDRAVVDACHAKQEESSAFKNGPCIGGISWLDVSVDYLEDPEGMIVIEETPVWQMLWPGRDARKKNLLDRDWDIKGSWYTLEKFKALWPTKVGETRDAIGRAPDWDPDSSTDTGHTLPSPWDGYNHVSEETPFPFYHQRERQVWVERYQRREPRVRFFVMVPPEGMSYADADAAIARQQPGVQGPGVAWQVEEMSPEDFRQFSRERAAQFEGEAEVPRDRYVKKERMVYLYSYHAGDIVAEEGEIQAGRFMSEAITGYPFVQPDRVDWRSVVDALRTPQIWMNIFLTMLVKYMQVNPKGVLFAERGVFRNRAEGLSQFSSAGGFVEVERGKLSGGQNPPFLFHSGGPSPMGGFISGMLTFAQDLLPRSAGFNQGALGQLGPDLRRISGTVIEHVRDAAVASHAELYDSYALARQRIGLILLALLGKVLGLEHLRRVVGEEPFFEEVADPATGEVTLQERQPPPDLLDNAVWSVAVEETKPAPDRMRFFWESMTESGAMQTLVQSGAFAPEDLVELAPDLPEEKRKKMLERIEMQKKAMLQAGPPGQPPQPGQQAAA